MKKKIRLKKDDNPERKKQLADQKRGGYPKENEKTRQIKCAKGAGKMEKQKEKI